MVASITQIWGPREAYEFVVERDKNCDLALDSKEIDPKILDRYDSQTEGIRGQLEIWEVMAAAGRFSPTVIDPALIQQEKEAGGRWQQLFQALRGGPGVEPWWEASLAVRDYLGRGRTFRQSVAIVDGVLQLFPDQDGIINRYWARAGAFDTWNEITASGGDTDWYVGLLHVLPQNLRDKDDWFDGMKALWKGLREYGEAGEVQRFIDTVVAHDPQLLVSASDAFAASLTAFRNNHLCNDCRDFRLFTEAEERHFMFATPLIMVHPNGEGFIDHVLPLLVHHGYTDKEIRYLFAAYGADDTTCEHLAEAIETLTLNDFSKSEQWRFFTTVAERVAVLNRADVLHAVTRTVYGYAKLKGHDGDDPVQLVNWCLNERREKPAEVVTVAGNLAAKGFSVYDIQDAIRTLTP